MFFHFFISRNVFSGNILCNLRAKINLPTAFKLLKGCSTWKRPSIFSASCYENAKFTALVVQTCKKITGMLAKQIQQSTCVLLIKFPSPNKTIGQQRSSQFLLTTLQCPTETKRCHKLPRTSPDRSAQPQERWLAVQWSEAADQWDQWGREVFANKMQRQWLLVSMERKSPYVGQMLSYWSTTSWTWTEAFWSFEKRPITFGRHFL